MRYPRYVFISHYWYTEYWWTFPILKGTDHTYTPQNCTVRQLTDAIRGSLAVDHFPMANGTGDEPTDVGTVSQSANVHKRLSLPAPLGSYFI